MSDLPSTGANKTLNQPAGKPQKRRSGLASLFNLLLFIAIIVVVGLFIRTEMERRSTVQTLQKTEKELENIRKSTGRPGEEVAKEVLAKVRTHIDLPESPAPTVATITDVDRLREANDFYKVAKNGDNLIITEKRAILFDPDRNIILDVVPVVVDQTAATPTPGAPQGTPAAAGTPVPSPAASGSPAPSTLPPR